MPISDNSKEQNTKRLRELIKGIQNGTIKQFQVVYFQENHNEQADLITFGYMNPYTRFGVIKAMLNNAETDISHINAYNFISDLLGGNDK